MALKLAILFLIVHRAAHSNAGEEKVKKLDGAVLAINGSADITRGGNGTAVLFQTHLNLTQTGRPCPDIQQDANITQTQLVKLLTAPCRYDRLERPIPGNGSGLKEPPPVEVYARLYISVLQNLDSSGLQFKMQGLLQVRYRDARLAFRRFLPSRKQPIFGGTQLRDLIWVPHIFLPNEHASSVQGTAEKDILISIAPDGTVIVSSRIRATLYCWMNFQKFPFDEQECSTIFESWMYNSSDVIFLWEETAPIVFNSQMHPTEYFPQGLWTNESVTNANPDNLRGALAGNYSSLSFTVHLTRQVGYYVMDYFLPSMMIVAISWVSFWLQADQTPARTTMGTSTLLAFITLASRQDKNLAKVNYVKVSDVWFLGCTLFIISSLVEFAFVNTIWRRNRSLELKKINSKYILRSTLTPSIRHDVPNKDNYLNLAGSVSSFKEVTNSNTDTQVNRNKEQSKISKPSTSWSTMSPHEVSLWIDRKARFLFPLAFLIFNAFFWTFVYCL